MIHFPNLKKKIYSPCICFVQSKGMASTHVNLKLGSDPFPNVYKNTGQLRTGRRNLDVTCERDQLVAGRQKKGLTCQI